MLYCSNSSCANPFNPDNNKFCIKCGKILTPLFRNRFRVIRLLGEGGFSRTYEARDVDKIDEPCVIKQFVPQLEGTAALEKATELFKQEAKRLYDLGEHPQIPRLIAYFEQQIWDSVGGKPDLDLETWKYFGESLGWRIKNNWKPYEFLSFTLAAPVGQLPRAVWSMRLDGRRKRLSALTSRLVNYKI